MQYYSTNNKNNLVSFGAAVKKGIAEDGGLFMPVSIPKLENNFFQNIKKYSYTDIAFIAANYYVKDDIPESELKSIITKSFTFPAPLVKLEDNKFILELFHGPTLAFKDFGARFMANTLSYLIRNDNKEITILVATSGDTGSAVANGFYNVEGINVILLYPSGKVSKIQEQQLTTLNGNITALEIEGTFDDCQRLVKQAFADNELNSYINLSSANSINIARLLPQSFYYLNAFAQLEDTNKPLVFSVPSGNLGNLTGGLLAMEMGLPVHNFIAAVNANDVVPEYLTTGVYTPKPSVRTMSNAMDVGHPSNFARIMDLYDNNHEVIKKIIFSRSYSDDETKSALKNVNHKYKYIFDPHGAVGYLASEDFNKNNDEELISIILETAHPAKFADSIEPVIGRKLQMPQMLTECMHKKKTSIMLSDKFDQFKEFLIEHN